MVTIDIGSSNNDNDEEIKHVLLKTIQKKRAGKFKLKLSHFEFKKVSGYVSVQLLYDCLRQQSCFIFSGNVEKNQTSCSTYEFQCKDGFCIDARRKCDGTPQCPDNSDESKDWGTTRIDTILQYETKKKSKLLSRPVQFGSYSRC